MFRDRRQFEEDKRLRECEFLHWRVNKTVDNVYPPDREARQANQSEVLKRPEKLLLKHRAAQLPCSPTIPPEGKTTWKLLVHILSAHFVITLTLTTAFRIA